jgi:hypothetical protein
MTALESGKVGRANECTDEERAQGRSGLELCPACHAQVYADVYAVLRRGRWYHIRCARHADGRDGRFRSHLM